MRTDCDVLIVGGGPAGLSAALVLGRSRRRVVVIDAGHPRNARSAGVHGFLSRDGIAPSELNRIAREQLAPYDVSVHDDAVVHVAREGAGFAVRTADGVVWRAARVLVATGMRDILPDAPGFAEQLGTSVFACPYCDGWEHRDQRLCAYAIGPEAADSALGLTSWSSDVALVAPEGVCEADQALLARNGVRLYQSPAIRLETADPGVVIALASGERVACDAIFVHLGERQASSLAERLGCPFEENHTVATDPDGAAHPGIFVAGDASHDRQVVAVAVAEGVKAACAINADLRRERQR
jgi:thioredoxin reductase